MVRFDADSVVDGKAQFGHGRSPLRVSDWSSAQVQLPYSGSAVLRAETAAPSRSFPERCLAIMSQEVGASLLSGNERGAVKMA